MKALSHRAFFATVRPCILVVARCPTCITNNGHLPGTITPSMIAMAFSGCLDKEKTNGCLGATHPSRAFFRVVLGREHCSSSVLSTLLIGCHVSRRKMFSLSLLVFFCLDEFKHALLWMRTTTVVRRTSLCVRERDTAAPIIDWGLSFESVCEASHFGMALSFTNFLNAGI